ncbi:MAG: alpha/beta hydrolase [Symploca sp. SIO1C2]|nr:alpha/beta hydrolase [Symploca sp. SIO1C2]
MLVNYLADMMVKPGKSPVFNHPQDYGLDYEDVTFSASDRVTLSGWLIKGGTDKVIIQSHFGVQCSRAGYTPKDKGLITLWQTDISFLNQAKYLVNAGYSVLMYDFRNHGKSETGTCPWISWGSEESKDVIAAVEFITTHPDLKDSKVGLLSICMGAGSTTYAYGIENGLQNYKNIKALIAVQPLLYPDFVQAMGVPGFLAKRVNNLNTNRTGFNLNTTSFLPNVNSITVPTMVIQNTNDPWTNLDFVKQYYNALTVEKEMLWLDLAKQRAAAYDYIGKSPEKILDFFGKYLD